MKLLIPIILLSFNSFGQTFQEALSEELQTKNFRASELPFLEYSNKEDNYAFFWHNTNQQYFLIFAKNNNIFHVMNCRSLPVGVYELGIISLFPKDSYESLSNSNFIEETENVMNNFAVTKEPVNTNIVESKSYDGQIEFDGTFLPIVVSIEIPVLYHYQNETLISLPLEY